MTIRHARNRITSLWFAGSGLIYGTLIVISVVSGRPAEQSRAIWDWALPTMLPTLMMMIGVHMGKTEGERDPSRQADGFFFKLTCLLSAGYLAAVGLVVFFTIGDRGTENFAQKLGESQIWLGPFQGLVAGTFGLFYTRSSAEEASAPAAQPPPAADARGFHES